jgi:hypothetical protein
MRSAGVERGTGSSLRRTLRQTKAARCAANPGGATGCARAFLRFGYHGGTDESRLQPHPAAHAQNPGEVGNGGKTMTVTIKGTDAGGKAFTYVMMYEKQ